MSYTKGGDVLARGGSRCQFPPAGGNVSEDKWQSIFADFKPQTNDKRETETVRIHPLDLAELLREVNPEVVDVVKNARTYEEATIIDGVRYVQDVNAPRIGSTVV